MHPEQGRAGGAGAEDGDGALEAGHAADLLQVPECINIKIII